MSFNPQEKPESNFELIEEGTYPARVARIIELGTQKDKFGTKPKVVMGFTVPSLKIQHEGEEKQRLVFTSKFGLNQSANPDTTLMKYIGAIDKNVTHMDQLLGKPCLIEIKHSDPKPDGTVYANIANVSKPMAGLEIDEPDCDTYMFEFANPDKSLWEKLGDSRKEMIRNAENFGDIAEALGE